MKDGAGDEVRAKAGDTPGKKLGDKMGPKWEAGWEARGDN